MSYSLAHPLAEKKELNLKTWQLLLFISVVNIVLMWLFNEFVLTREVYHNLLAEKMEATRIDEYFNTFRKVSRWGYAVQPVLLLLQIVFISLLIQMPLVLMFNEIPFACLFRLATWGSLVMTAATSTRFFWLLNMEPGAITSNILGLVPFSINHLLDASQYPALAYATLGKFNVFELVWCLVIYRGLIATGKIKRDTAGVLIFLLWTALLVFQWGVAAYLQGINA